MEIEIRSFIEQKRILLSLGEDLGEMHQTPLDLALKFGHTAVAELLRKKGARSGADLSLIPAAAAGDLKSVRKHVHAGADINEVVNGELSLCIALEYTRWDVATYLLNKKCDVTKPQKWDETPLHVAASTGAPDPDRNRAALHCPEGGGAPECGRHGEDKHARGGTARPMVLLVSNGQ